jgi:hypothetical protein
MRLVPPALRGHVFALLRTTMQAGAPLGGALGGAAVTAGTALATALTAFGLGAPGAAGLMAPSLSAAALLPAGNSVAVDERPGEDGRYAGTDGERGRGVDSGS